jgi:hypothetical protein
MTMPTRDFTIWPVRIGIFTSAFTAIFALASVEVHADPRTPSKSFEGRLLESGTRRPLASVRVYLLGTPLVARTDARGRFAFAGVAPGTYKLTARTPQHKRIEREIKIPFLGYATGTFYLERRPYDPYEVVVRAPRVVERPVQHTVRLEEIARIPGIQGDALKVVQNLPGVARIPFGFGGLVVRGSSPQDSLAFLDGHPIPQLFHFLGLRSTFNSDVLERIDFIPGNYPADFGRLTGGILDVATRAPKRDGVHGFVDVNLFDAGFLVEGPVGAGSIAASARRSYIDAILPLVLQNRSVDLSVAPRYYDYQVLFRYPIAKHHELKIMAFGSEDELVFLRDQPPASGAADLRGEFKNNVLYHRLLVGWNYKPSGAFENRFSAAGGIDRFLLAVYDRLDFIRDLTLVSIRNESRFRFDRSLRLAVGLDLQTGRERFGGKLPRIPKEGESPRAIIDEPVRGESRESFFNPAVFAILAWRPFSKLTVTPQIRWDYYSRMRRGALDPRLTLRYEPTDGTAITAAAGIYHQQPFFDELSPVFGNPNLGPLQAVHYSLGLSQRFSQATSLDVTAFYKNLSDLVVRSETPVVRNGQIVSELLSNQGRGEVFGLELLFRQQLYKGFFGWIGYTLMRSARSDGPGKPYRTFQFDQTHILTLIASYKLPRNWQLGVRWRFVTGFPLTPFVGGIYDADADRYRPIPGPTLSERIPAFHQLDFRVDKEWVFDRWKFGIYLDIQNVYNRENPEAVRYNYDYTQRQYITGLPVIPMIGFRGEW